jgi:hypothetical protein
MPTAAAVLVERMQACSRFFRCNAATQAAHLRWAMAFLQWQQQRGDARPPSEWGRAEVNAYLNALAARQRTTAGMHRQALQALLFLFRHALGRDLLAPAAQ